MLFDAITKAEKALKESPNNEKLKLALDIKKFYDNCQRDFVYQFFKNKMQKLKLAETNLFKMT